MPIFRRENGQLAAVPGNYAFLDQLGKLTVDSMLIRGLVSQIELGGGTYFGFEAGLNDDLIQRYNTGVGYQALLSMTNGHSNTALGHAALQTNINGHSNIAVGRESLRDDVDGYFNTAIGRGALQYHTTGHSNTALGLHALIFNITGSRNVALGSHAGRYELGSDALYVNNQDRINTADEKLKSIIYGIMAAAVANQHLTFNANVKINGMCGLNNVTPVGMAAHIADPTDLATCITAINSILVVLKNLGAVATA